MPAKRVPGGLHVLWCALLACALASAVQAQTYPQRPVRIVVPYSPGGGTDTIARFLALRLTDSLGQPVIVENRAGADSRIGTELVARAVPDGYTLIVVTNFHSIAPSAVAKLGFDPVKSFAPITLASRAPNLLVVHTSVPARSVAELVKLARGAPGRITCGTAGRAQTPHINLEMLKIMARIDITLVPFKGGADAITALRGGHVDMAFASIVEAAPHARAGALRALGITSENRSVLVPEVPTMIEAGFPGYVNVTWHALLAPAGTPRSIIERLNADAVRILRTPDMQERLLKLGLEPSPSTPDELEEYIRTEIVRLGKVIKDAGIRVD